MLLISEENKKIFIANADGKVTETLESRIDITQIGNINLLLTTTTWILHLYHNYKANNIKLDGNFIQERQCTLTFWIKDTQSNVDIKSKQCMKILLWVKGEIVVVDGRTERWMAIIWNKQEWCLLPVVHCLLYLVVITKYHLCGHLAENATIARIKSKYWIISVRVLVK